MSDFTPLSMWFVREFSAARMTTGGLADKLTTRPCQFCGRPTPVKLDTRHKPPIPTIINPFCKNPALTSN